MLNRIATGDWDGIILSHETFQRLPMSPEFYKENERQQIAALVAEKTESYGDAARDKKHVKLINQEIAKLQERLARDIDEESKEVVIPFEELGIDQIFVDESDMFKNLGFRTHYADSDNKVKGISTTTSKRSEDMFLKTRWLTKLKNGGGVVFATGTPVSNTLNEFFTLMRYLGMEDLIEKGLVHFDNWAATFAVENPDSVELSASGEGFKKVTRLNLTNFQGLSQIFRKFADILLPEDCPNLNRPKLKGGKYTQIIVEPSETFKQFKEIVVERFRKLKRPKKGEKGADNALSITTDYRKASLDMRLIDPTIPESEAGGKIAAACDMITKKYHETAAVKGTQVVFLDLGTPRAKDDNRETKTAEDEALAEELSTEDISTYARIKEGLIKRGIPKDQIAFVHDAKDSEQRKALFARVNDGDIRIIIGSTQKMGAGTNFQEHLVALHHLDCPWRPRDLEQREGRILRAGNLNPEVEMFTYVLRDSYDSNMWEKVTQKQNMIHSALRGDPNIHTLEDIGDVELAYAEVMLGGLKDPQTKRKAEVELKVKQLQQEQNYYFKEHRDLYDKQKRLQEFISMAEYQIGNLKADISDRQDIQGDNFKMKLGDTTYENRKDATIALEGLIKNFDGSPDKFTKVGEIGGFDIKMRSEPVQVIRGGMREIAGKKIITKLVNHGTYSVENSIQSMQNLITKVLDRKLAAQESLARKDREDLEEIKKQLEKPFDKQAELEKAQKELDELIAYFTKKINQQAMTGGEAVTGAKGNLVEKPKFDYSNPYASISDELSEITTEIDDDGKRIYKIDGRKVKEQDAESLSTRQAQKKGAVIFNEFSNRTGIRFAEDDLEQTPSVDIRIKSEMADTKIRRKFNTLRDAIICAREIYNNYEDIPKVVVRGDDARINCVIDEDGEDVTADEAKKVIAELDAEDNTDSEDEYDEEISEDEYDEEISNEESKFDYNNPYASIADELSEITLEVDAKGRGIYKIDGQRVKGEDAESLSREQATKKSAIIFDEF